MDFYAHFFMSPAQRGVAVYEGIYDPLLVTLSVLIAVFAAYTAFQLSSRLRDSENAKVLLAWRAGGALALGMGIWAMHFVGMLAFRLECGVAYDLWITFISILPGFGAAWLALGVLGRATLSWPLLVSRGVVMGAGIGTLHYTGMAALQMDAILRYDPWLFMLSVVVAILLAVVALSVKSFLQYRTALGPGHLSSLIGGVIMGGSISGMHYTAMEAAYFIPQGETGVAVYNSPLPLAISVAVATLTLLLIALGSALASRRIAHSRRWMNSILQNMSQGFVMMDLQGRILEANPALLSWVALSPSQVQGEPFQKLLSVQDHQPLQLALQQLLEGQPVRCALSLCCLDAPPIPVQMHGNTHRDEEGQIMGIYAILTDIRAEQAAAKALRDARDAAEQASQAKGEFLANMSHEIRTPMNAILGMTHLCLQTDLNERQRHFLEKVYAAGSALLRILNDILDFSKIEAGSLEIEKTSLKMDEVLASLADLMSIRADEKKIELLFHRDANLPEILVGDPLRLGQVLINLVGNALKFTEQGEVVVRIEVIQSAERQVKVRFSVKDTGIGLTNEQMSNIFQSFKQADSSTTRRYGGTGLGLAISHRLVQLMGGVLKVESTPGQGSCFSFTLDLGVTQPTSLLSRLQLPSGLQVLVVDDNVLSQHILHDILQGFGCQVQVASSGEEALLLLAQLEGPFDFILMDWQMPGLNGIETAQRIYQKFAKVEMPTIIMVTAHGREEVMQKAREAKLDGFLMKPVNPSMLLEVILQLQRKRHGTGPLLESRSEQKNFRIEVPNLQGKHILLAEDNDLNVEVVQEMLSPSGVTLSCVSNGLRAVEAVQKRSYDLVLMDLQMPVMDGREATKQILGLGLDQPPPIIALTANALSGDRERCMALGMVDHIAKPLVPELFYATIKRHLGDVTTRVVRSVAPAPELPSGAPPGVDLEQAWLGLNRNTLLLNKLLHGVCDQWPEQMRLLEGWLADPQSHHLAINQAHGLRGLASQLRMEKVATLAGRLEQGLKQGEANMEACLAPLQQAVMVVVNWLKENLDTPPPEPPRRDATALDMDKAALKTQVAEIMIHLDQDLAEGLRQLREVLNRMPSGEPEALLREALNHAEGFDVPEAKAALMALQAMLQKG
ncbi:multi-sensor hybrid histidine kinase [Magnetococcus marinus MC-1]|uniref:Sensory/regulatory protein RpfC n=1 Tax=Magnetococcus marinus (strain ATCC BAA-1437 / JCM 17883 / MC-1) TaxID=156889 RepID=A0LAG3_MAGMM|nr:response regulator [Magnetococcus marinus]ABK44956.1 multi-sensor hybrid histidine kinase [Magnetococcus marinus MC-1]